MRARFREGFDRPSLLKPGQIYKYDIDLWFTSRVIPAGHRLRVVVASAAFPKYDRNLNTGECKTGVRPAILQFLAFRFSRNQSGRELQNCRPDPSFFLSSERLDL